MSSGKKVLGAIIIGVAITLITGLVKTSVTASQTLGTVSWYGLPLGWFDTWIDLIASTNNLLAGHNAFFIPLVVDVIFWSLIAFGILFVVGKLKKK